MLSVNRRQVLRAFSAAVSSGPAICRARPASAALPPLPTLLDKQVLLLRPEDSLYENFEPAFNARTMLRPRLRALCKTAKSVSTLVDWCRENNIPFALRSGGHCFEGLSQSSDVVIDTRLMNDVRIDDRRMATVGAGASLGAIYKEAAGAGLAFPGGACPTVGIAGQLMGGGYGYLARTFGLACDSLVSLEMIDARGREIRADAHENSDLFWASRGGGGGSFGALTRLRLQLYPLSEVLVFRTAWDVSVAEGARIMKAWQRWAPRAPRSIAAALLISRHSLGVSLRCIGQSTGSESDLRAELRSLSNSASIERMDYLSAVNRLAGVDGWKHLSLPMKGKSDYVAQPMSDDGLEILMTQISRAEFIRVICDPYGGTISDVAPNASAFAHRTGTLYGIQYATDWSDPHDGSVRMKELGTLYAAMRPYVSGSAYVNYCDIDLANWAQAYWGSNLPRLMQIKATWDPDNLFHHAQSIPLR